MEESVDWEKSESRQGYPVLGMDKQQQHTIT